MHDIRGLLWEPFNEPGTLLYIGARPDACAWLDELHEAGNEITLIEIWWPNYDAFTEDPRIVGAILGDIRLLHNSLKSKLAEEVFDYVWWWHGPEHVSRGEVSPLLNYLRQATRQLIAVAAPWGRYPQGAHEGNNYEAHQWSVYEKDLRELGFETVTDGEMDKPGSEIVGWLRI